MHTVAEHPLLLLADATAKEAGAVLRATAPAGDLSAETFDVLGSALAHRLRQSTRRVAEWEQHVSRSTAGLLPPSHRCESIEEGALLSEYPALALLWRVQRRNWLVFTRELLSEATGFARRRGLLKTEFRVLAADCSDLHNAGRSVTKLSFYDGSEWMCKPRPGKCELVWFKFLRWLNEEGFAPAFLIPELAVNDSWSWMQAITPQPCSSRQDVPKFFFSAGALLYLVHYFRGVDCHAGNVIAAGAQPVLVDCETLLHPDLPVPPPFAAENNSLLRTGFLPIRKSTTEDSVSSLGRRAVGPHQPVCEAQPTHASTHVPELIRGFCEIHRFLAQSARRQGALATVSRQLGNCVRRAILRPTAWYHQILQQSLSPHLLRKAKERQRFLVDACADGLTTPPQRAAEVSALQAGDIPVFRAKWGRPRQEAFVDIDAAVAAIQNPWQN